MRPAVIVAAAAVSAFGLGWRGLSQAAARGEPGFAPSVLLAGSHPGTLASEVAPIARADDAGDVRQRKLMTRPARLAAIAARLALAEARFTERREEIGFFLGVGASGVAMEELPPMLRASQDERGFSLARFGREGLQAQNPLFAFQTMNNFTLCHAAILSGTGGPNAALYSRGGGTVLALAEALHALEAGECDRALAGGADSALHPVTWSELGREGLAAAGLVPGEGAALLAVALAAEAPDALARVLGCARESARRRPVAEALDALAARLPGASEADVIVIAPWGPPLREALAGLARRLAPAATVIDLSRALGEALAATPALAWVTALDSIVSGGARRALALSAGLDGEIGGVLLG
jgi:3-oxoacyl-(acyl-carrier-protein) synthase